MATPWKEVEQKPEFQQLPPEQKQAAQEQYFNEVVAPQAGDNAEQARIQFFNTYNYAAPQEQGFIEGIKDMFTGASRTTPELEALDTIMDAPELNEFSMPAFQSSLGFLLTGDQERQREIIQEQFPDASFRTDAMGNIIAALPSGEYALQKPGLELQDIARLFSQGAAFTPAGRATQGLQGAARIGAGAAGAGATGAAIEGATAAVGGGFEPENIAMEAVTGGALEGIPVGLKALQNRAGKQATEATAEATAAEAARVGQPLSPEAQAAQQQAIGEQILEGTQARRPGEVLRTLAGDVGIDPERLAAAERLGVADELLPSQLGRNQQYIEIEQGLASIPGSQLGAQSKQAIGRVAEEADKLITEFGGTTDKAGLSEQIKDRLSTTINDLGKESDKIYKAIDDAIPKNTRVTTDDARSLIDAIGQSARDLGSLENLDPLEKKILDVVTGNPTYTLLDRERKKVGEALRKSKGVYKDAATYQLKRMYGLLTDTQENVANRMGASDMWATAKGLVAQRKQIEDDSIFLMGKDLAASVMPKLGRAVKGLSAGKYRDFDRVMQALPKDMREEAVLSALNDAFTMGAREQKSLSAPGFVDWYNGLNRNKANKRRIMENLPEGAAKRLDDIYKVAEGIRNASKERITTGRIQGLLESFGEDGGVLSKVFRTGAQAAAAEIPSTVTGLPGVGAASVITSALSRGKNEPFTKAADAFLSDPKFKQAVKAYADTSVRSTQKQAAAAKALERSSRFQRWYDLLPTGEKQAIAKGGIMAYLFGEE
ncbi:hypothetical protein AB832_08195 [Flavobacteriaceae bacterium (ex Bugula neritina AB1)]|nr:hypothetical protein AB832_08195 [Flavobacteriaceae bacterium (ex Bugula neritina AB1)]